MAWYDDLLDPFRTAEYESGDVTGYDYDWGKIIGAGTGAISTGMQVADLLGFDVGGGSSRQPAGYQGGIPSYSVRVSKSLTPMTQSAGPEVVGSVILPTRVSMVAIPLHKLQG